MGSFFTLYDVLSDDDEEIRRVAADVVRHFSDMPLVPLEAGRWLVKELLPKQFGTISRFWEEVKRRAAEPVEREGQVDFRLFAVEKVNLYRDEERDRKTWREVLYDRE